MSKLDDVNSAIKKFFIHRDKLYLLEKEDIAFLPKNFLMLYEPWSICELWNKLPSNMQTDVEMKKFQICFNHMHTNEGDVPDGPLPMKRNCIQCNGLSEGGEGAE